MVLNLFLTIVEAAKEASDKNRLIPPFSLTATDPAEVYPLHDIIPEAEWKALSVSSFDAAQSDRERIAMLPYRKSTWVNDHLKAIAESTGKSKKKNLYVFMIATL
jgi:DNA-directed RNA polymerase I subunit RPA49